MRPVSAGDQITIGGEDYVFSEGSANLFNIALHIKNKEGAWPDNGIIVLRRRTGNQQPVKINRVSKAVEKAQS